MPCPASGEPRSVAVQISDCHSSGACPLGLNQVGGCTPQGLWVQREEEVGAARRRVCTQQLIKSKAREIGSNAAAPALWLKEVVSESRR
mmetsp:Transcript_31464/g.82546  ORF Transcript_31464/g.82546 Transcript_31464/m.82546 type:complete len:89 (-) Transcript_31464:767-1033(-)